MRWFVEMKKYNKVCRWLPSAFGGRWNLYDYQLMFSSREKCTFESIMTRFICGKVTLKSGLASSKWSARVFSSTPPLAMS